MQKNWRFLHVGMVVRDMVQAVKHFESMGIGPFPPFLGGPEGMPFSGKTVRGKKSDYDMDLRLARGNMGGIGFELIQPIKGPSVYHDFLEKTGGGFHHMAFAVEKFDEEIAALEKAGFKVIQTGAMPNSRWAYVDTKRLDGLVIELCEAPKPK